MLRKVSLTIAALLIALPALAFTFGAPKHYVSAASTNSTLVQGKATLLTGIVTGNSNGAAYYLKLYDKATAPTCGTDAPVMTIVIPANGTTTTPLAPGALFSLGLGFCLTGAFADSDTTNAATGVSINFVYN